MQQVLHRLNDELHDGMPNLIGTHITGEIPLSTTVVRDMIPARAPVADIAFEESNVVTARVLGLVSLKATIIGVEPPLTIILRLSGLARVAAWTIKGRWPFVRVEGGVIKVDLGALPQASRYDHLLRYLRLTGLRTSAGRLIATFEIVVSRGGN